MGVSAVDALYRLLGTLTITPVEDRFLPRLASVFLLYTKGQVQLKDIPRLLRKTKCTPTEREVLALAGKSVSVHGRAAAQYGAGRPDPEGRGYPGEALHLAGRHLQHPYGYRADHPRPVSHPAGSQQPVPEPEDPVPEDLIRKEKRYAETIIYPAGCHLCSRPFLCPVLDAFMPCLRRIPSCWS